MESRAAALASLSSQGIEVIMNIWIVTGAVAIAVLCSYVFTWLVRMLAPRFGLVDLPDGDRKLQRIPISLGGGVAFYAALVGTVLAVTFVAPQLSWSGWVVPLLLSSGLLCMAGLWDDKWPLRSWHKLLLQIAACLPLLLFGQSITAVSLLGYHIDLGWASTALTLFWLVACINAVNLIDGLDGLAGTLGIIATATLGILAIMSGSDAVAMLSLVASGALAGFLIHNLPPARIYLGDAGSCCIGLLIGAVSIQASNKTAAVYLMAVPLVLLGIPFFDTLMAIMRRKLSGRHVAIADREHIHHCLQDRGLSSRQTLLVLTCLSLLLALSAIATFVFRHDLIAIATCAVTLSALVACQVFGHREATMLISRMRIVAENRWKRGRATVVDPMDAPGGEISKPEGDPLIIRLPGTDQTAIAPDAERGRRAA